MFSDIGTWASVGFVKLLLVKLLLNDWVVEGLPLGNARFCKDDAVGLNMKLLQSMLVVGAVSLTGCASFIANNTAPAPLGVPSSERSFAQVITDNGIARTAKINLYKLDDRFNRARVNIDSFHSVVLLTGQVPDQHLKMLAEQNVKTMRDVQAVHNYISIGEQIGYQQIVQDGWITTTIRAGILRSSIRDTRVKVNTEAGVVYVMGRLSAAEADEVLALVQNTEGVQRIVSLIDTVSAGVELPRPAPSVQTLSLTAPVSESVTPPQSAELAVTVTPLQFEQVEAQPLDSAPVATEQ